MAGDTFQKFKSSLNRGVTAISVKTSSSLEKAKIKTHIDSLEAEIQRLITSIGEMAYVRWENKDADFSVLEDVFVSIQQKKAEIEKLNEELLQIDERDKQILGNVAAEATSTGTDIQNESGIICPGCGTLYETATKFCRKCGYKLQES